jgi:lipopolysaccharide/colanic/teichoic acid biosynthesis glycosyltransferase
VLGNSSIPFEEMIKLDYLYVSSWTLWTDIALMLKTLRVLGGNREFA